MVDSFECLDYQIIVFSIFYVSNRVGPVLIVLNTSDLEVVSTTKHSSSLVGLGVWTRQQIQLARPLTANRFCIHLIAQFRDSQSINRFSGLTLQLILYFHHRCPLCKKQKIICIYRDADIILIVVLSKTQ